MLRTTRMALAAAAVVATGAACSGATPAGPATAGPTAAASAPAAGPTAAASAPAAGPSGSAPAIDPAAFGGTIDNPFFPLRPGMRWEYRSRTEEGVETTVVTVTTATRTLMGVTCVEVRDTVRLDAALKEDTRDWYAQDRTGAVWYFGEDTKEYENGKVSSTEGSWLAGVGGGRPGIIMPATPTVGDRYRQEYLKGEAEDQAAVISLAERATVPAGSYQGLVMTEETTPLEPGVREHKYYARGIGVVLTIDLSTGGTRDELVRVTR